jgi:hypothetical protein
MPAVGELVRCTNGSWMVRPPEALPARSPARRRPHAGRAPALRLCWRAYDLDVLGVRWRGVRAAANGRVPCPGWPGRGAVTAVCQPATAAVIAARISSSSTVSVIGTTRCLPPLPWRRLAAVRSKTAPVSRGEAPNAE